MNTNYWNQTFIIKQYHCLQLYPGIQANVNIQCKALWFIFASSYLKSFWIYRLFLVRTNWTTLIWYLCRREHSQTSIMFHNFQRFCIFQVYGWRYLLYFLLLNAVNVIKIKVIYLKKNRMSKLYLQVINNVI